MLENAHNVTNSRQVAKLRKNKPEATVEFHGWYLWNSTLQLQSGTRAALHRLGR